MNDETWDRVREAFDRYVYRQLDDDELQEHLLTDGVMDDLRAEGRDDKADDILWEGL